ncbi:MAG: hypothetical protein V1754_02115 [Pseudomonadota bacterium]
MQFKLALRDWKIAQPDFGVSGVDRAAQERNPPNALLQMADPLLGIGRYYFGTGPLLGISHSHDRK